MTRGFGSVAAGRLPRCGGGGGPSPGLEGRESPRAAVDGSGGGTPGLEGGRCAPRFESGAGASPAIVRGRWSVTSFCVLSRILRSTPIVFLHCRPNPSPKRKTPPSQGASILGLSVQTCRRIRCVRSRLPAPFIPNGATVVQPPPRCDSVRDERTAGALLQQRIFRGRRCGQAPLPLADYRSGACGDQPGARRSPHSVRPGEGFNRLVQGGLDLR